MSQAQLTAPAEADVDELLEYYAAHSRKFAAKLATALHKAFRHVGRNPRTGKAVPYRPAGMRKLAVMKHLVFFRSTPTGVEILRVLDGRRLIDADLFDAP